MVLPEEAGQQTAQRGSQSSVIQCYSHHWELDDSPATTLLRVTPGNLTILKAACLIHASQLLRSYDVADEIQRQRGLDEQNKAQWGS